jgi:uncharacterized protein (DUF1919 family)
MEIIMINKTRVFELEEDRELYLKRCQYTDALRDCFMSPPSIISNNCLAGRIYQDLELSYLSPTAGLYFFFPDYIEFLADLESNIKAELYFTDKSKYELGNQRIAVAGHRYPIANLNNKVEIHFLHYSSKEEATEKWTRRCSRVNLDNLLILACERDLCTEDDICRFDNLPFERKIFFTAKQYNFESSVYIDKFKDEGIVGDPRANGQILYENIVNKLGK